MAEQSVHDVVNQEQSVGDLSPSDASATKTNHHTAGVERVEDQAAATNDFGIHPQRSTGTSGNTQYELGDDVVLNSLSEVNLHRTLSHLPVGSDITCRSQMSPMDPKIDQARLETF